MPTVVKITATGPGSVIVPDGVTSATVRVGAAGGSNNGGSGYGGGGGGALSVSTLSVTPGSVINYMVGAAAPYSIGGDSWFISATTLMAKGGGMPGDIGPYPGAGGDAALGYGSNKVSGGDANGGPSYGFGTGNGNGGSSPMGGAGGAGGYPSAGSDGSPPGGGAGGSFTSCSGGRGEIEITWADPVSGGTSLNALTPTTASVTQGISSGFAFQTISGFTSGSTRQIVSFGGATGVSFTNNSQPTTEALMTTTDPLSVGTFNLTIRETLAGASNSPRDSIVTLTVNPATLADIIWSTPTIPDTTAVGAQVGYLNIGRTNGSTIALTENDGGRFAIDSTGRVTVAASLIGYSGARFIRVRETLAGATNSPKSTLAQVNVTAPTLQTLTLTPATVGHNAAIGSVVGTINGRTSDASLNFNDPSGLFTLGSGTITTTADLSNRIGQSFNITMTETRAGADGSPKTSVITITVVEGFAGPMWRSTGTVVSSTGSVTPGIPAGTTDGDFLLLICESAAQTVATPGGWSAIPSQVTGTAGSTTATGLYAFYKTAASESFGPTVSDPGDHVIARIHRFDPAVLDAAFAGSVASSSTTAVSIPSITTTAPNALVVGMLSVATDIATSRVTAMSNANLTNVTKRSDDATTQGNGGGISLFTGEKVSAGSTGPWSGTIATSSLQGRIAVALVKPSAPTGITGSLSKTLDGATSTSSASSSFNPITASLNLTLGAVGSSAIGSVATSTPGAQPWTPASTQTRLWLDVSDASSLSFSSYPLIASIADKSNDARAITVAAPPDHQPNVINGLPAAYFSTDRIEFTEFASGSTLTAFFVVKGEPQTLSTLLGNNSNTLIPIGASSSATNTEVFRGATTPTVRVNGSPTIWANRGAANTAITDGTASIIVIRDMNLTDKLAYLGAGPFSYYFKGLMGEVVITSSSTSDLERIEGYMAHKWGLATSLPADHPYKSAAPTTGSAGPAETMATLTQTLGQMSAQASATVIPVRSATLAQSLAPASSVGSATVSVTGLTNKSLAPATSTATASATVQGSLVRALGGLSSSSVVQVQVTAQSASSLAPAASSANGQATISATASPTLRAMVSVGSAQVTYPGITGSMSTVLGGLSGSSAATVQITAQSNRSLNPATSVSQTSVLATGSTSAQLAPATVTATGGPQVSGGLSATLAPISRNIIAGVAVQARVNASLEAATLTSTVTGAPVAGLIATLGQATATASATVEITGAATPSLASTSVQASGSSTVTADASASLSPATSQAQATAPATGMVNRALDGLQAVSQATSTITGSVSATLAPASVTASSGSSTGANLTSTLAPTSVQSTGVVRIGGATIAGLGPMTGQATGFVPVAANSNTLLSDLTAASNVVTPIFGRATATLEPMSAQAVAYVVIDATTGAQLGSLVLSSEATARRFGILEVDPTRVVVVPADARSVVIPADTRLVLIPEDSRAVVVTADDRVVQVPSDPRSAA